MLHVRKVILRMHMMTVIQQARWVRNMFDRQGYVFRAQRDPRNQEHYGQCKMQSCNGILVREVFPATFTGLLPATWVCHTLRKLAVSCVTSPSPPGITY
jgi:hypothetical protein